MTDPAAPTPSPLAAHDGVDAASPAVASAVSHPTLDAPRPSADLRTESKLITMAVIGRGPRVTKRYCRACGYDLQGLDTQCPECGRAFNPGDWRTYHAPMIEPAAAPVFASLLAAALLLGSLPLSRAVTAWVNNPPPNAPAGTITGHAFWVGTLALAACLTAGLVIATAVWTRYYVHRVIAGRRPPKHREI